MSDPDGPEPTEWSVTPQPTLRTERLLLRPLEPADAPRVRELAGDRAVADTTGTIPHPYPDGAAEEWVSTREEGWRSGRFVVWALVPDGEAELVGVVSLALDLANARAELGYWIGAPYWGRGYATEASRAAITFGFRVVGLNRVEATYLTRNPASGRVMEKLGMRLEGVFRQQFRKWGIYEDIAQRAVLRSEWGGDGPPSAA